MYWRPVQPEPLGHHVHDTVRFRIAPHFFDHDGTLSGSIVLDAGSVPYLQGVIDGMGGDRPASESHQEAVASLRELVEAISAHGLIELEIVR